MKLHKILTRNLTLLFVGLLSSVSSHADADIINFSQSGDDLVIEVTSSITLTSIATGFADQFGLVLEDVYSAPQAWYTDAGLNSPNGVLTVGGVTDDNFLQIGIGEQGIVDTTDIFFYSTFPSVIGYLPGTPVTLNSGVYTAERWFSNGNSLPDQSVTQVQAFAAIQGVTITDPLSLAVPEPSTAILGLAGIVGLVCCRRRLA